MTGKRVLVTGAGGFIGRWSVPPLLAEGYEVHAVTRAAGLDVPAQLRGAELHATDLLDAAATERLLNRVRPTHLLHFAWIATPGIYWTSDENRRWLASSTQLLRHFQAQGGVRAVMAGTCAEYDWSQAEVCIEGVSALADEAGATITPYAQSKLALYRELQGIGRGGDLSTAWGRIFFQYGPDEHPDRLVASVIINLLQGREAACSHGRQVRSFLHVADVGAAFAALLRSGVDGPVNVGSGDRTRIADVLGRIGAQIGRPELVRLGARPASPSEPALLVPDVSRLRDEVGFLPRFDLDDGLADTIGWWRGKLQRDGSAARR